MLSSAICMVEVTSGGMWAAMTGLGGGEGRPGLLVFAYQDGWPDDWEEEKAVPWVGRPTQVHLFIEPHMEAQYAMGGEAPEQKYAFAAYILKVAIGALTEVLGRLQGGDSQPRNVTLQWHHHEAGQGATREQESAS